jgi:hypothetical protein
MTGQAQRTAGNQPGDAARGASRSATCIVWPRAYVRDEPGKARANRSEGPGDVHRVAADNHPRRAGQRNNAA